MGTLGVGVGEILWPLVKNVPVCEVGETVTRARQLFHLITQFLRPREIDVACAGNHRGINVACNGNHTHP